MFVQRQYCLRSETQGTVRRETKIQAETETGETEIEAETGTERVEIGKKTKNSDARYSLCEREGMVICWNGSAAFRTETSTSTLGRSLVLQSKVC
jgi:hypothetical protein